MLGIKDEQGQHERWIEQARKSKRRKSRNGKIHSTNFFTPKKKRK